ncbi:hypothetical protein [Brevibacterium paucivorans]|uniref:hypothetical protein n=1 Tax=Brevibacterium paucivorans TaxID=170994 RepID=UPI00321ADC34
MNKDETVDKLRADRDRVLHKIAKTPAEDNSRILYTLVKTLTRSIQHIIVTAENEKREQTQYEGGHITAWTSTLRTIEQDLDALKKGK